MSAAWLEQRERGSAIALSAMVWFALTAGRTVSRLSLVPICAYFILFSRRARASSLAYLTRALGRRARLSDLFRHYHAFASTLHDRIYLLAGRIGEFEIEQHGLQELAAALAENRGCILLGSHLGSFDLLRVLGTHERKLPVNVVMYPDNAAITQAALGRISPEFLERVIPLGRPGALLRVKECLERREIVGILGDRILRSEKTVACEFLGGSAPFPQGPLQLACTLKVPVVLFFGLYQGGPRYSVHFERLAMAPDIDRRDRAGRLALLVARYAQRLEHYCRVAPYNWFNFYDFWRA